VKGVFKIIAITVFLLSSLSNVSARSKKPTHFKQHSNLLMLAAGWGAKHMCSCIFVLKRNKKFCKKLAKVSPDLVIHNVNYKKRKVTSSALLFFQRTAYYQGQKMGCTLK
jgi:hypothetical protein